MKREYSAGIVTFYKHHDAYEFLLLHYESGHWDFPKGHIEQGETKESAALRELFEETGLTTQIVPGFQEEITYFFRNTKKNKELIRKTVYFFLGEATNKKVVLSHEHCGYMWLPFKQAIEQVTYKNAQDVLQKCYDFLKNN